MSMSEGLTLGELINKLKEFPEDAYLFIKPFNLTPSIFTSYRGYYEDLSLNYDTIDNCGYAKVGDLLKASEECIGKTFYGWKGGEFKMDKNSTVWLANSGETTELQIKDLVDEYEDGSYINILTLEVD